MTGRTEPEAVQNFLEMLQKVVSCVSDSVISVRGGYHASVTPHRLILGLGGFHSIGGPGRLFLSIILFYRIIENDVPGRPWKIITTTYYYTFADESSQEVIAYHWHPTQRSNAIYPHLHMESGAQVGRRDIANAHLPTGWVTLTDVIRLAITELGVTPRREDWQDVLAASRAIDGHLRG